MRKVLRQHSGSLAEGSFFFSHEDPIDEVLLSNGDTNEKGSSPAQWVLLSNGDANATGSSPAQWFSCRRIILLSHEDPIDEV